MSILILHTFIPHQHIEELSEFEKKELENPDSFIDYVKIMFLTDLGEGHMESFDQVENYDFNSEYQDYSMPMEFPQTFLFYSINPATIEPLNSCTYLDDIPILRRCPDEHIDFRGPPIQV